MQQAGTEDEAEDAAAGDPEPTIRRNFTPVAVWSAATESDAEGRFSYTFRVPDTLTRYRLFCTAADAEGDRFGNDEKSFEVRQPVMLTPGTPLFMRTRSPAPSPARIQEDARLLLALHGTPDGHHAAFLAWMRSRGRDYRHPSTWTGAWTLIALREYLGAQPASETKASVRLADGLTMELSNGVTRLTLATRGQKLGAVADIFAAAQGTTYVNVVAKAKPTRTEYPGITEKGLQVTRLYEKKNAEGKWQPATEFNVGDVVRVTLTCAKVAPELEYLVLEDSLPSCMEAVNPAIRSQAAGIDFVPWSAAFDNKEFLADRVRGFCTRWGGRNLLNMVYFARVKRSGVSVAPPAQAQLMYEPQTHGLSPNAVIISK